MVLVSIFGHAIMIQLMREAYNFLFYAYIAHMASLPQRELLKFLEEIAPLMTVNT